MRIKDDKIRCNTVHQFPTRRDMRTTRPSLPLSLFSFPLPSDMSSPMMAPSSALGATPNSSSLPRSRPLIDPLAFDDVHGLGGSLPNGNGGPRPAPNGSEADEDMETRRRGGRRARFEDTDAIPRVKDATGEKVMESFALFLEK